ncbi:two-component system sensor histidine kinase EvgS [Kluyvera sp. 1366]
MRLFLIVTLFLLNGIACSAAIASGATELTLQPRMQVYQPQVQLNAHIHNWLKEHPEIRVAVWGPSHPPLGEGMELGIYQGINADYLAAIQNILQVKFRIFYYPDSKEAMEALRLHQVQMLALWDGARWPDNNIIASIPWLIDENVLLMQSKENLTNHSQGLIGAIQDEITPKSLRQNYPAAQFRFFSNYDMAVNAVLIGQFRALWLNRTTAEYLVRYHQLENVHLHPSTALSTQNFSFGVDRHLTLLHASLNIALEQLPLASRIHIAAGWGVDRRSVIKQNPLGLTTEEVQWLKNHVQIEVLLNQQDPPLSYRNNDGLFEGLIIDILDELKERYNLQFTYYGYDNAEQLAAMRLQHPDALVTNHWHQQSASTLDAYHAVLFTTPAVVVMSKDVALPNSFNDLKGERLSISRDNPLIPWIETWYPSVRLVKADSTGAAMQLLNMQRVRGVVIPQLAANYLLREHQDNALRLAVSVPTPSLSLMMSSADNRLLPIQIIRKALNDLSPDRMMSLAAPWHKLTPPARESWRDHLVSTLVWSILTLLIVIAGAWWIVHLYRIIQRGKLLQVELTNQLSFTQTLIDNTPVAIYARDRAGRLIHFNRSWSDTVKRSGEALLGKTIADIDSMDAADITHLEQRYQQVLALGEEQYWSGSLKFDGESRLLSGWSVPWRDNNEKVGGLIGGWLDLSEKEKLIANLKQAKDELEQVNASKNAFMQSMGHEIRTPLNAIIGLLEIELQQPQACTNENLPLIWEAACSLLSLIGDVFDIFRADNQQLKGLVRVVNLPQLIESITALYRLQAEENGLKLEAEYELKTETFSIDSLMLIRMFSSLIRNAIKHGAGEVISVAVYQGRTEPDAPTVPLVIEVANQGIIQQEKMSEAQSTGWSETGMTLAACKKMADGIGAELTIESDEEDTVVSFHFYAEPVTEELRHQPATSEAVIPRMNIMIVDDYAPGRRALRQQLESWGHKVTEAENGLDALTHWDFEPGIDLIITDCTMPEMDGFELARIWRGREAKQRATRIPIFGLTALTGPEAKQRCITSGMDECLLKPLSANELRTILAGLFPSHTLAEENTLQYAVQTPEIMAEILSINQEDALALQQFLNEENHEETGRMAHRILGGANLMREQRLVEACEAVERACNENRDWSEIISLVELLLTEIDSVNNKLIEKLS